MSWAQRARPPMSVPSVATTTAIVAAVSCLAGLTFLMGRIDYDVWGALVVGPTLLLVTVPIAYRVARAEGDATLVRFLMLALLAKFAGSLVRYITVYGFYDGVADASKYDLVGQELAQLFRDGQFGDLGQITGTRSLEIATGAVYTVIGPSNLGGFLLFAWFAFLGFILFYRAFRIAFPDGDHSRYRLLLFFLPSLLFWPSSIGKESLVLLFLGACAYGLAQVLDHRGWGFLWLGLGLWGSAVVRPHMALVFLAGAVPAVVLRRNRNARQESGRAPISGANLVLMLCILGMTVIVAAQAQEFFGLADLSQESAEELLAETESGSARGGSEFTPSDPNSPSGYLAATLTVLVRPFFFEASSAQALFSAAEGMGVLVLILLSLRRLRQLPVLFLREPLVAFAVTYSAVFIYAFSVFSNFGLLARQRTQLFPVFLMLLALPHAARVRRARHAESSARPLDRPAALSPQRS